jgi:hypothetical protein
MRNFVPATQELKAHGGARLGIAASSIVCDRSFAVGNHVTVQHDFRDVCGGLFG